MLVGRTAEACDKVASQGGGFAVENLAEKEGKPSLFKMLAILELANQEFGLTGVKFTEVMDKVNECYAFTPCQYTSGVGTPQETVNPAGTNSGSLKTYFFAHLHGLDEAATLRLFCEHYKDVLDTPDGDSHANIRAFMVNGWDGIAFEGEPLKLRDGTELDDVDSV